MTSACHSPLGTGWSLSLQLHLYLNLSVRLLELERAVLELHLRH